MAVDIIVWGLIRGVGNILYDLAIDFRKNFIVSGIHVKRFYYGFILLWSVLIFHETIKWNQILGVIVITIGIVVGKKDDHR